MPAALPPLPRPAGASAALLMMGWPTAVLWLDRAAGGGGGGGGLWLQRGLGVLTWGVLALAMRQVVPLVRVQTLVVVAFATVVEYAPRPDALAAFWFGCLVLFTALGPSKPVYVGAFVVVSWLELLGTHLGNWRWGSTDFTGWVTIGNPPSGAAGGYGWFDLVALLVAPRLLAALTRRRARRPVRPVDAGVR